MLLLQAPRLLAASALAGVLVVVATAIIIVAAAFVLVVAVSLVPTGNSTDSEDTD